MKNIKIHLDYIFYWLITSKKRRLYSRGMAVGMRCIEIEDVSKFFPASVTEYTYDPNQKPVRDYLTKKEFFAKYK